ncbi:MAG: cation diffusion facilitator family transporter [Frankiales bacterium]|nr:cation diffusion facilitator family transporter [Frankiales bacterium]
MASETRGTVLAALAANLAVAVAKAVGGIFTGSAALLAEAAHSVADTLNEVFLLLSLRKADRPADRTHPFGYGKERFFWSLLAAVGIFVSGAGYSAYEGVEALRGTEDEVPSARSFLVVYAVLLVSLALEGASLGKALKQVRSEAAASGRRPLAFVRRSPDPTVKTVASEDTVAVVGVLVALTGTALHQVTGDQLWDGVASLSIAALLAYVAVVLGRDTKELLIGEAADPAVRLAAYDVLTRHPEVEVLAHLLTMQLGPTAVLVAARVRVSDALTSEQVRDLCSHVEAELVAARPEVVQVFVDVSGAREDDAALLDDRLLQTVEEVRELDGTEALPEAFRSRTVRRASAGARQR